MSGTHEPRDEFVNLLERHVSGEVRRRNLAIPLRQPPRWMRLSPIRLAGAAAALTIVSMALGGGVVAAAYRAQTNQQRSLLLASYQQRLVLARQQLAIASEQLRGAQLRFEMGTAGQDAVADGRFKVVEAEAHVQELELQIVEIQATGKEPQAAVSSPLVSGRDFVSERWRVDMSVPQAALDAARVALQDIERRVRVGMASPLDLDKARSRMLELEPALQGFQKKLVIRQQFLKGDLDAAGADLRILETDADQRRLALVPRIELARKQLQDLSRKVNVGTAQNLELAEAELRLQQLQLELTKANYDLAAVRDQLAQRKK